MSRESVLFTPIRIAGVAVPNRFVRSATHDFMSGQDGSITARQVDLYAHLAEGEVGLIISGHAYVNRQGKASPGQIAADDDRTVDGLGRIAEAVHRFPSRIFLQIAHAGRQTKEKYCGCTPVSPSAVPDPVSRVMPRELNSEEIAKLAQDFIRAGLRAHKAGFDGIQLHLAHGYLLSAFISPHTNRRQDDWGGSTRKRTRIVIEIVRGLKGHLGKDYPVIAKLNTTDFLPNGLTPEESGEVAGLLEAEGLDGIEASGGTAEAGRGSVWQGLREEEDEGYFLSSASILKKCVKIPVFGLGGLRTFRVMEKAILEGKADLISTSRPLIRDPWLIRKFRLGEAEKSACISCNKCFNLRGIRCAELE